MKNDRRMIECDGSPKNKAASNYLKTRHSSIQFTFKPSYSPITRNISPEILRPLVQAIREKKRVDISYTSLKDGEIVERIICPLTLVCTPLRWHVRAYCEHAGNYRDFVLSRIHGIPELNDAATYDKTRDNLWNKSVVVELVAEQRFNDKQKAEIEKDFGMSDDVLSIATNSSLIRYVLDAYNIDILSKNLIHKDNKL